MPSLSISRAPMVSPVVSRPRSDVDSSTVYTVIGGPGSRQSSGLLHVPPFLRCWDTLPRGIRLDDVQESTHVLCRDWKLCEYIQVDDRVDTDAVECAVLEGCGCIPRQRSHDREWSPVRRRFGYFAVSLCELGPPVPSLTTSLVSSLPSPLLPSCSPLSLDLDPVRQIISSYVESRTDNVDPVPGGLYEAPCTSLRSSSVSFSFVGDGASKQLSIPGYGLVYGNSPNTPGYCISTIQGVDGVVDNGGWILGDVFLAFVYTT